MSEETKTKKKPRVLKRHGKNIEESVLFHDDMDEELLAKIEESLSGRSRKVLSQDVSPTQKRLVLEADEDDPGGREVVITVEEKKRGEKTLDLSQEEPGESSELENISEVTVSLDENESEEETDGGPDGEEQERSEAVVEYQEVRQRRGVLYWMFLVTCFFSGLSGGLWCGRFVPTPEHRDIANVRVSAGRNDTVHVVQEMFLPLDKGENTLYLDMAVRIHGPRPQGIPVTDESLREVVYEASMGLKPSDLKGYHGMRRLKARVEDLMRQRYPDFEVRDVTFLNYVVL